MISEDHVTLNDDKLTEINYMYTYIHIENSSFEL